MNSYIQKEINRQYLKMTRPKANFRLPDLKAYYSVRNDLDYYRYNDAVMADLIRLNLKYFDVDRRMNRYLLFSQTVRFIWDYLPHPDAPMRRSIRVFQKTPSAEVVDLCFQLFQRVSTDQYDMLFRSQGSSNFWNLAEILMRVPLNDDQIDWILAHALTNERVASIIEQTSQGNKKIAEWAKEHWLHENLSGQRARYAAHLMDWDADFESSSAVDQLSGRLYGTIFR
jgi:hypothetical protein